MAYAALAELALRRMASVAIGMCLKTDWYRFPRPGRVMTSRASFSRASGAFFMGRVVKLHIETLDKLRGKCLDRRILSFRICVANRTHDLIFVHKLIQMAADAGFMTAQLALDSALLAKMTSVAGKLRVLGNFMRKGFERLA